MPRKPADPDNIKNGVDYRREYNETKYERLYPYVKKGQKAVYEAAAKRAGMTLNEFIVAALDEKISRETATGV